MTVVALAAFVLAGAWASAAQAAFVGKSDARAYILDAVPSVAPRVMPARLVPDADHRAQNWWPIECRGSVLVERGDDGRLQGTQRDYVCRTIRR